VPETHSPRTPDPDTRLTAGTGNGSRIDAELVTRWHTRRAGGTLGERMRRIIVFDVNETLLDVGALAPQFHQAFNDGQALREWFSTVLLYYSEVATLTGLYHDFPTVGGAALDMIAAIRDVSPQAMEPRGGIGNRGTRRACHGHDRNSRRACADAHD
jgi:hypothetical protein